MNSLTITIIMLVSFLLFSGYSIYFLIKKEKGELTTKQEKEIPQKMMSIITISMILFLIFSIIPNLIKGEIGIGFKGHYLNTIYFNQDPIWFSILTIMFLGIITIGIKYFIFNNKNNENNSKEKNKLEKIFIILVPIIILGLSIKTAIDKDLLGMALTIIACSIIFIGITLYFAKGTKHFKITKE